MVECPSCGEDKDALGNHWHYCEYPSIPQEWDELFKGLMLGDGSVTKGSGSNPYLSVSNVNREFLEWLDSELEWLTNGVAKSSGSKHSVHQYYSLTTRRMPHFEKYRDWYTSEGVVFPESLELTAAALKMWYVSDGRLIQREDMANPMMEIANRTQIERESYLSKLFEDFGVSPSFYTDKIAFGVDDTPKLLDAMGDPVPGFEHKFDPSVPNPYGRKERKATEPEEGQAQL